MRERSVCCIQLFTFRDRADHGIIRGFLITVRGRILTRSKSKTTMIAARVFLSHNVTNSGTPAIAASGYPVGACSCNWTCEKTPNLSVDAQFRQAAKANGCCAWKKEKQRHCANDGAPCCQVCRCSGASTVTYEASNNGSSYLHAQVFLTYCPLRMRLQIGRTEVFRVAAVCACILQYERAKQRMLLLTQLQPYV
jgi:hypothetical protein